MKTRDSHEWRNCHNFNTIKPENQKKRARKLNIQGREAVNTCIDINQRFDVGPADRVLALSSLSFDLSVYDIFGLLATGGAIVMPDASGRREPSQWATMVAQDRLSLQNTFPAQRELLLY